MINAGLLPTFCAWSRPAGVSRPGCWVIAIAQRLQEPAPPGFADLLKGAMITYARCPQSQQLCLLVRPGSSLSLQAIAALPRPRSAGSRTAGSHLPW